MQSGAEQLKIWIAKRCFSQREAAKYFGWDEAIVSKFVNGERTPGLDSAIKIERETGIPVEAWVSSDADESKPVAAGNGRKRN